MQAHSVTLTSCQINENKLESLGRSQYMWMIGERQNKYFTLTSEPVFLLIASMNPLAVIVCD